MRGLALLEDAWRSAKLIQIKNRPRELATAQRFVSCAEVRQLCDQFLDYLTNDDVVADIAGQLAFISWESTLTSLASGAAYLILILQSKDDDVSTAEIKMMLLNISVNVMELMGKVCLPNAKPGYALLTA
ncbi:uncharacterized protein LOC129600973 [Paramacrobiotus metropolitanus]|uniref:uncharacterized protein LOC129600973 n=1 Tax=Paramacrobiotus metropolitanus TaxID=2943436 RepID=UPI002445B994|nr:uncharacterized protein LOC129600973 [Paramacrobiotus metropolitanus]